MKYKWPLYLLLIQLFVSCGSYRYTIVDMKGSIVEMNQDQGTNSEMQALVDKYKGVLDDEMNVVVGTSSKFMPYGRPESLLTNFTSDVMKEYGDTHLPNGADVSIMNVNGHRAFMPEGEITMGNLYEIYSFDNTIAFLELKGEDLMKIFDAYARIGGAGISSNAHLLVKDQKIVSATLDGKPIDKNKIYNVVTLDYLADGNNSMTAFKNAVKIDNTGVTLRDIMIDYVHKQTAQEKEISSVEDGRITIE